jgi:hypothetical protein
MAQETNGDGTELHKSGLYRSKDTGVEMVLHQNPGLGSPVIDAFVKAGFERVGDIPTVPTATPKVVKAIAKTKKKKA